MFSKNDYLLTHNQKLTGKSTVCKRNMVLPCPFLAHFTVIHVRWRKWVVQLSHTAIQTHASVCAHVGLVFVLLTVVKMCLKAVCLSWKVAANRFVTCHLLAEATTFYVGSK